MLNGKYKCLFWVGNAFVKGEIYEFKDGIATTEYGCKNNSPLSVEESPFFNFKLLELPQPHKSLLRSGDKVVYRNCEKRFVLLEVHSLYDKFGAFQNSINNFDEYLNRRKNKDQDIIEIWRGDELIAKRIEKSAKEIEIERIENEMRKLADDLRKVKGE